MNRTDCNKGISEVKEGMKIKNKIRNYDYIYLSTENNSVRDTEKGKQCTVISKGKKGPPPPPPP